MLAILACLQFSLGQKSAPQLSALPLRQRLAGLLHPVQYLLRLGLAGPLRLMKAVNVDGPQAPAGQPGALEGGCASSNQMGQLTGIVWVFRTLILVANPAARRDQAVAGNRRAKAERGVAAFGVPANQ
jgi:hypothetical protein